MTTEDRIQEQARKGAAAMVLAPRGKVRKGVTHRYRYVEGANGRVVCEVTSLAADETYVCTPHHCTCRQFRGRVTSTRLWSEQPEALVCKHILAVWPDGAMLPGTEVVEADAEARAA